jgi:Flp pilus assembly protein TadG
VSRAPEPGSTDSRLLRATIRARWAERGAVTAELAMAVPLLLAVTLGLVWLLTLGTAQVRMVDATREAARAVARGDSVEAALDRGQQVAPPGAALAVTTEGDRVVVSGTVEVDGVGGLFEVLPSVELTAQAVSAREDVPP